jgi:hypothetical protein
VDKWRKRDRAEKNSVLLLVDRRWKKQLRKGGKWESREDYP